MERFQKGKMYRLDSALAAADVKRSDDLLRMLGISLENEMSPEDSFAPFNKALVSVVNSSVGIVYMDFFGELLTFFVFPQWCVQVKLKNI